MRAQVMFAQVMFEMRMFHVRLPNAFTTRNALSVGRNRAGTRREFFVERGTLEGGETTAADNKKAAHGGLVI
ncbi:hypothetical protein GCM10007386_41460 [Pseudoduganella dura]|nr:hypothetical protein GCM10007386_41460 [Pseudoduganella dura]